MSFHFSSSSRLREIRKSFSKANSGHTQHLDQRHQPMMSLSEQKTSRNSSFNHSMMPSVKSKLIKNFGRTKEKIMQGMGKSDRTSDQNFDAYVHNFEAQHAQATKLNKELNKYLSSLRETQKSSQAFYDTLRETYEAEWPAADLFAEQIEFLEMRWADYLATLHQDVQLPLLSYLNEFPEHKKKIEKRYNRLLDFDNARHTLQSAEHKTSKKLGQSVHSTMKNASAGSSSSSSSTASTNHATTNHATTDQLTKLTKLKIDLEDKQHVYEDLNQTLCLALPVLYQNRIKFYSSMFQTFFHTETTFHSDCVEAKSKLDDVCEKLSLETGQRRPDEAAIEMGRDLPPIDTQPADTNDYSTDDHETEHNTTSITEFAPNLDSEAPGVRPVEQSASVIYSYLVDKISESSQDEKKVEKSETFLYRVKAIYGYDPKEIDELAFDKDDVIEVVDGTESEKEDLDEGWLIGVHEPSSKRGLFPENFTKRI